MTETIDSSHKDLEALRLENAGLKEALVDQERLRDELAKNKALAKALFDVSTDSICLVDQSGTVLDINEPAARRLHAKPADIIGRNILELLPPELSESRWPWFKEAVDSLKPIQFKDEWGGDSFGHRILPYYDLRTAAVRVVLLSRDITATDKALRALRESEARYRAMVELQEDAVCRWFPDTTLTYVNQGFCRLFGKKSDELLGRRHLDLLPGRIRDIVESQIESFRKDPHPKVVEHELIQADGSVRWLEWNDSPILNDRGELIEVQSVGRDITERKAAERALQEGADRYRGIVEDQTELICRYLPDGRLSYVNEAYARYFNKDRLDLIDKNFIPHIPEPDLEVVNSHVAGLCAEAPVTTFEHRVIMPGSNEIRWQKWTHRALYDNQDALKEFQAVGHDITERKLALEEIRQGRAFLHQIIDTVPCPIFVKDSQGVLLLVNRAMAELHGVHQDLLVGRMDAGFSPDPEEAALALSEDRQVLRTGQPVFIPQRAILHACGERRWYAVTKLLIRDKDQLLGIAVDITDRIEAESARASMEKHLRQVQKLEALGTLAGGIAHDFNNLIFAILGFVRLALKATPEDSKAQEYLAQIQLTGLRASELVRQILTFSRRTEQEKKTVRVSALLNEIIQMLQATIPPDIEIEQRNGTEDDSIFGDPIQIHQVLMNLCTNAAQAMRGKGGRLTLELAEIELIPDQSPVHTGLPPGKYLEIRVGDTGHGIDPHIIEQIFDPFFTTKRPGEGTGMGLSVAHGIVKNHGGAIVAESEVGKGSLFRVLFPKTPISAPAEDSACAEPLGGTERILFVDDEALLTRMMEEMLEEMGYQVTVKCCPREALAEFCKDPWQFDLVITDYSMPGMTGLEMAKDMHAARPDIPVVLLTSYSELITPEAVEQAGIRENIRKPLVVDQLARTLRRAMGAQS